MLGVVDHDAAGSGADQLGCAGRRGLDAAAEPADGEPAADDPADELAPEDSALVVAAPDDVLPELQAASRATAAVASAASRSGRGRRVTMVLLGK